MKNKTKLIISSLITALPIVAVLLWRGHFNPALGNGWHFAWILPLVLLTINVVLHLLTSKEMGRVEQNKKIVNISYFILPIISVYVTSTFVMIFLGMTNFMGTLLSLTFGTLFIVIGNYMPKAVRNRWFGIKIYWTLGNDENWIRTHRLAGKVSFISGVVVLFGAFLPDVAAFILMILATFSIVIIPIIYSYSIYRKHVADGSAEYNASDMSYSKNGGKLVGIIGAAIAVILVAVIFVGGDITYTVGEESLDLKGGGMSAEVDYDDIENIELRREKISGSRVIGYASLKMQAGNYDNAEFGAYMRFTYSSSDANIVIHTNDGVVVLSLEDTDATVALYETLLSKIGD